MDTNMLSIDSIAQILDTAALQATATAPLNDQYPLTIEQAYQIQSAVIARRIDRGERIIGIKMGFTSQAKMAQMGVADQICGQLTDAMRVANGGVIALDRYIHPRCEPEVAFLLKHALPHDATEQQAFDAIEAIAPAIEIIDSRYRQFRFSLTDVIADNASSAGFVLGDWITCPADLVGLKVALSIDGEVRQTGATSDILGNPVRSLVAAARLAAQAGMSLQAGSIILAGAATAAEALAPGMQIAATVASLGKVGFSVERCKH